MKYFLKLFIALLVLAALLFPTGCNTEPTQEPTTNKAVIIDQLSVRNPNPEFITQATNILESYGFEVDVWRGNDITVDFYYKLPSMGYRFVILRAHSGLLVSLENGQPVYLDTTYLFTTENYSTNKYVGDQLADRVSNAVMEDNSPLVFAVNSEFIKRAAGKFSNSIILAMGCESYKYDDMPAAFMEKGASAYIGWSDTVTLQHVDGVTLDLLQNLCSENMTLSQGIASTMSLLGNDPYYNSYLKYFPSASGNSTVAELLGQPSDEER
jgi:hypothetical protein